MTGQLETYQWSMSITKWVIKAQIQDVGLHVYACNQVKLEVYAEVPK